MLSRNPSVERTFSLPSNPTTSGSFLLPSYPLAMLPGGMLTPTLSRRHVDSSLSMSNTWPNKRENSPHQQDTSPWSDPTGAAKGNLGKIEEVDMTAECKNVVTSLYHVFLNFFYYSLCFPLSGDSVSSRCSPRPLRASLVSSSSTSSFRRALSSTRTTLSISPVVPTAEQFQSHNDLRSNAPGSPQNQQLEKDLNLDPDSISAVQDSQEDDPLDMQEVRKSVLFYFL